MNKKRTVEDIISRKNVTTYVEGKFSKHCMTLRPAQECEIGRLTYGQERAAISEELHSMGVNINEKRRTYD